jgi:hypothetical protein
VENDDRSPGRNFNGLCSHLIDVILASSEECTCGCFSLRYNAKSILDKRVIKCLTKGYIEKVNNKLLDEPEHKKKRVSRSVLAYIYFPPVVPIPMAVLKLS